MRRILMIIGGCILGLVAGFGVVVLIVYLMFSQIEDGSNAPFALAVSALLSGPVLGGYLAARWTGPDDWRRRLHLRRTNV